MNAVAHVVPADHARHWRYARCLKRSRQNEWQIDCDVIRGRSFDLRRGFLPEGLSLVDRLEFLTADEARFLSQVQGRTYAYLFGLVERFIGAKMLDRSRGHALSDLTAMESLLRFSGEEVKHQEMFRRIEEMLAAVMPPGYVQVADPAHVAAAVLAAGDWAVLALTCHIELFVQAHYEQSIAPRSEICPLWKDVFQFHWKDECQHVLLDELEWTAEHARLDAAGRDRAVDDLIGLVGAVDGLLVSQAAVDAGYFLRNIGRRLGISEAGRVEATVLAAYRWQYILSGMQHVHFSRLLKSMTTPAQMARIQAALAPIAGY
ncbi:MAG: hypothetical protein DIU62_006795 [Pseudomonadota bacterium]|jgi:hypothetical protein|nr:MAG: hypothetical protein DIU62_13085 [Pseudomonadota bacterium]